MLQIGTGKGQLIMALKLYTPENERFLAPENGKTENSYWNTTILGVYC